MEDILGKHMKILFHLTYGKILKSNRSKERPHFEEIHENNNGDKNII